MIQLWAWEYEGKTEVGTQKSGNSCVFKSAASEAIPILRHTDHITNLRKVKVVDEDAIVFDKEVLDHWRNLLSEKNWNQLLDSVKLEIEPTHPSPTSADGLWVHDGKEWRTRYAMWRGKPLKTKEDWDNYYLAINPPVTEPKNFGAIVEAQYFGYNSEKYLKARFFNNGRDWILEGTLNNFAWSDLNNPTIISEGVES